MLKQASVKQIRRGEITRRKGYIVITMRRYPRGLKKELRDEYNSELAPDPELLKDFKKNEKLFGHGESFKRTGYVKRFHLSPGALLDLEHYAGLSRDKDVFFVCQCELGERCHREMLMLMAREKFGAVIGEVFHDYLPKYINICTNKNGSRSQSVQVR